MARVRGGSAHRQSTGWIAALGWLLLMLSAGVPAQPVIPPPVTDPGRQRERFDVPARPPSEVRVPELRGAPREPIPESVRDIRVKLHTIRVVGAHVYTPEQLREQTDPYLGREISGSDIFGLAQAMTARYRNDGYFLTLVVVPPQSLQDGVLTLRAIEGYIASVRVEGDARVSARLLEIAEKIQAARPAQVQVLERYLLIANDIPGLQLRSVLAPSETVGAADLTLIASVKDFDGYASVDNYGSRYLGPNQATLGLSLNQPFRANDQLRFIGVGTGDTQLSYAQLSYSQALNDEGLNLGLTLSQARTRPGDILRPFDVRGRADAVAVSLGYPFVRTRNESLFGRVAYDSAEIDTDILGSRTTEDRIRALRAGLSWQVLDRLDGQNNLDVDISQGVGGTSATALLKSRVGADGYFNKLTFEYTRFQPWGPNWGLGLGLAGQWTESQPLLSSEQFALGGRRYGRAYEAAELVGDRGLALRLEPRYAAPSAWPGLRAYQLLAFYDLGEVSKVGAHAPGTPASQTLASAGLGARLYLVDNITAQLEAAWPLTKAVASAPQDGKAVRLLGSLVVRF